MSPHLLSSIPDLLAPPTAVSCTCVPVPLLLCCCGPRRSAKQTHSPAIWAKQQRGEGRPCLQSVVVQQQEGNTGRAAAAAAAGGTTAADRYCRLRVVHGDLCMLVTAAMQPALAVPPAMGGFACPGTFQQALDSAARIQSFPLGRSTERSAKSAKALLKNPKYASCTT